jgi:hypothetical protein
MTAFEAAPGKVLIDKKHARSRPLIVLRGTAVDDSQGFLSFLERSTRSGTVTVRRNDDSARSIV